MPGASGRLRITDRGVAKRLEGDSHLTGTGQILGTPSYMPPEQAAGKTDEIGAADVYALVGQRHFEVDRRKYKHDAPASGPERNLHTRLRFVLVWPTKVALSD